MDGSSRPVVGVDVATWRCAGVANVLPGREARLPLPPSPKWHLLARLVRNVPGEILRQVTAKPGNPACHA